MHLPIRTLRSSLKLLPVLVLALFISVANATAAPIDKTDRPAKGAVPTAVTKAPPTTSNSKPARPHKPAAPAPAVVRPHVVNDKPTTDLCTNIPGNQSTVPSGNASVDGICSVSELTHGDVTICHSHGDGTLEELSFDLNGLNGHVHHASDVIPAYSWFDNQGELHTFAAQGDQTRLAAHCAGVVVVVDDVTCEADQTLVEGGCVDNPDADCLVDQTATNLSGGPTKETCVDNPDALCDNDFSSADLTGGPSRETCVPDDDVECAFDEIAVDMFGGPAKESCAIGPDVECDNDLQPTDTNGNGVLDTCVPKDLHCLADESPTDTNDNGVADSCVPIPLECPPGSVGVDVNFNGNADVCNVVECPEGEKMLDGECRTIGSCTEGTTWHDGNENGIVDQGECVLPIDPCHQGNQQQEIPRAANLDCAPEQPQTPETPPSDPGCPTGTQPINTVFGGVTCVEDNCPNLEGVQENPDACAINTADESSGPSSAGGTSNTGATGGGVADVAGDAAPAAMPAVGSGLPYTGGPLGLLALLGAASLGAGTIMRRSARRRTNED